MKKETSRRQRSETSGRRQATDELLQLVRELGRLPTEYYQNDMCERQLAEKVRRARKAGQPSSAQETELQAMARNVQKADELWQQVRDLGRLPKGNAGRSVGELQLDERARIARKAIHLSKARKAKHFSPIYQRTTSCDRRALAASARVGPPADRILPERYVRAAIGGESPKSAKSWTTFFGARNRAPGHGAKRAEGRRALAAGARPRPLAEGECRAQCRRAAIG